MHRYLRAIGFSGVKKREQLRALVDEVVRVGLSESSIEGYFSARDLTVDEDDRTYAELSLDFVHGAGICIRGEFDDEGRFLYAYYFPYVRGMHISSTEDISVERHAEKESFAGICDDIKVGVTLIFYLQNIIPYKKYRALGQLPIQGTSLVLSALSVDGTIMMPINKNESDKRRIKKASSERNQLIAQARMGDEDAIESLTLDDMDTYTIISRKIHKTDVFSLVDTYFMPFGVECDQYSILGEIIDVHEDKNRVSGEDIVFMTVECNELVLEICINKEDLYGEASVGRRFKGIVWLQGFIEFP